MRTPDINLALEKSISKQRLGNYLAESGDDLNVALTLYERNTKLAECLYTPLQSLEICLRNTVDVQMGRIYGLDWLANGSAPLNRYAQDKIQEAIDKAPRGGHGDWVAELKFSFWVSLAGPSYDATIWRRSLHACFRSGGGRPRSVVHGRLNAIRRFRNRVAHHEPIFARAEVMHAEILEAIGWMCPHTKSWTEFNSRFTKVFAGQ